MLSFFCRPGIEVSGQTNKCSDYKWSPGIYLVGPGMVRLCLPENEQGEHRHPVKDPDREAEEVNQALNVPTADHGDSNQGLE